MFVSPCVVLSGAFILSVITILCVLCNVRVSLCFCLHWGDFFIFSVITIMCVLCYVCVFPFVVLFLGF